MYVYFQTSPERACVSLELCAERVSAPLPALACLSRPDLTVTCMYWMKCSLMLLQAVSHTSGTVGLATALSWRWQCRASSNVSGRARERARGFSAPFAREIAGRGYVVRRGHTRRCGMPLEPWDWPQLRRGDGSRRPGGNVSSRARDLCGAFQPRLHEKSPATDVLCVADTLGGVACL